MSTYVSISEPKSFSLRHLISQHLLLGVPLALWALALLLIAAAAHSDMPVAAFEAQELMVPF
jgi:hypothetical protein